jgi:hypothetical protein
MSPEGLEVTAAANRRAEYNARYNNVPPSERSRLGQLTQFVSGLRESSRHQTGGTIKYPLVNQDNYQGKITFSAYKAISIADDLFTAVVGNTQRVSSSTSLEEDFEGAAAVESLNTLNSQTAFQSEVQKRALDFKVVSMDDHCHLYMPASYIVNDNISYDTNAALGMLGTGVLSGAQGLQRQDLGSSIYDAMVSTGKSFFDAIGALSAGEQTEASRIAIARANSQFGGPLTNAINAANQIIVNPNVRALFNGVALREYAFQFKFIPSSASEAAAVKDIIRYFRKHAYPEHIPIDGFPVGYKFPSLFKIKLTYRGAQVGTRIKLAYLRNIQTNYNPSSASFHSDGNPVETDLSINFVEYKTLSKSDITSPVGGLDEGGGF